MFYHPSPDQRGKSYSFAAGLISDAWGFDAAAFGMSPREAEQVDPQQRHLLEVTYDALAHACVRPSTLAGTQTGVYVGASSVDHAARFLADPSAADVHMMTGNTLSVLPNRLSYTLNLHGPSFTVDTACSSSLVALSLAAEAIRNGTVETAIVAGVNLLLSPFSFVGFSRASMLSPTGRCRPFDAAADGYVRGEGVVVLVLRSMAAARRQHNRIHAAVVGSAVGQDGRTTGLSLPSAASQRHLLEKVYDDFSVDPTDLSFVEAHGTGTQVGDPIEADALGRGLGQRRSQSLPIGSVKSNIGHLEPASGLAGVVKCILALNKGVVPATLHQNAPSPHIQFDELNLRVLDRNWPLPERRGPHLAGVNSFGFGGTNAHVILRADSATSNVVQSRWIESNTPPLLLSAHCDESLRALAGSYVECWPNDPSVVHDYIGGAAHLRDPLPHRAVIHGRTHDEIKYGLAKFAGGKSAKNILTAESLGSNLPVAFLFSGNGSQWFGMGRAAWTSDERFRDALTDVDAHFSKQENWSLVDALFADDLDAKLRRATYAQPLLLALQIATVRVLEDCGLAPAACLGHSVGEIGAAWCAGLLSLDQAISVVIARSRHQEQARGSGSMAAIMLGQRDAQRLIDAAGVPAVCIAAINSWRSVTVSGPIDEIERFLTAAADLQVSARKLDLDYPFHSSLVDPVRAPLLRELSGLRPLPGRRPFVSSVLGDFAGPDLLDADYWWRNIREPVQFDAGLKSLLNRGHQIFVEIGPKPILSSYVRDSLREAGRRGIVIDTLTESSDADVVRPIERTVSRVLLSGGEIDLNRFFGSPPIAPPPLPLYPWRHSQYAVHATAESTALFSPPANRLLGLQPRADSSVWFSTVDPLLFPWIADHKVGDAVVFPATGIVEVMLAAASELYGDAPLEIRDLDIVHPLIFDNQSSYETSVRLARETGLVEFLSRPRGRDTAWLLIARGVVGKSPVAAKLSDPIAPSPGTVIVSKARVYEVASSLGFGYGASFQRVRHVSVFDSTTAVGTLEPISMGALGNNVSDITGFDAAFHALFASEDAGVADMPLKRMLPVRFGQIRLFSSGTPIAYAVARTLRHSLASVLVDIELLDEHKQVVLAASNVRLIDASPSSRALPRELSYRVAIRQLDRAGCASPLQGPEDWPKTFTKSSDESGESSAEALLLLEAACLQSAWTALKGLDPEALTSTQQSNDQPSEYRWPIFLRSALLWHLESRHLVVDKEGRRELASNCDLPELGSVVRSLVARHPTMAGEAAQISRLDSVLGALLSGETSEPGALEPTHLRQLGASATQIDLLSRAVLEGITHHLRRCDPHRLLRLLFIGATHTHLVLDLSREFPQLEIILTDVDSDSLETAQAQLGDDAENIRCIPWDSLQNLTPVSIDIACSINKLCNIAAIRGGLAVLLRQLRPKAPLIAGELAPSVFWDIVRGTTDLWWSRSASADFPVGALLTKQEWLDELQTAGFGSIEADPILGQERIGVVIRGICSDKVHKGEAPSIDQIFSWQQQEPASSVLLMTSRARLGARIRLDQRVTGIAGGPVGTQAPPSTNDNDVEQLPQVTDIVCAIDARSDVRSYSEFLSIELSRIAESCKILPASAVRFSVVMDFGADAGDGAAVEGPLWSTISAALRVAQNEYPGVAFSILGCAGTATSSTADQVVEELLFPSDEREVFFQGERRLVFRLQRGTNEPIHSPLSAGTAVELGAPAGAARDKLSWTTIPRSAPSSDEIEIEVTASGLNFRDVMWNLRLLPEEALEDGYAGPRLGIECAGTITKVGSQVEGFAPGDHVLAFVPGAFASHVIVPAISACALPSEVTLESAATIPVAFLTAYYSLVKVARLKKDETVLLHGGAGAVGLAALQVAKLLGARVIATAGTEEKRALLRNLGADAVFNSRTLAFSEEIMSFTQRKGVDVVVNSLAGEAMIRSMDCLGAFGRFIELGKRDFYANTHVGLRPFRRNLSYFGVDVDQLIGQHRELMQSILKELKDLFDSGALRPLPYRIFRGEHIEDAFRLMQRSGHIGKILIAPAENATERYPRNGRFPVDTVGVHVIFGGTSGFGLATAEWLADRGARHLVLASKSGRLDEQAMATVECLRSRGTNILIERTDIRDEIAVGHCLTKASAIGPIKGLVHAAMVIDDQLIESMSYELIESVLQPKMLGADILDRLSRDMELDYFLLFSSATTLLGNPGQYNYVAANAFLEGLARQRFARGFPALAVAWGGIEDTGYLSRHLSSNVSLKKRFSTSLLSSRQALDGLDWAYDFESKQRTPFCSIGRIDWAMASKDLAIVRSPAFVNVLPPTNARQTLESGALHEKLRSMPLEQAVDALLEIVVQEIARVLRLAPKEVDRHRPLADIGMDFSDDARVAFNRGRYFADRPSDHIAGEWHHPR